MFFKKLLAPIFLSVILLVICVSSVFAQGTGTNQTATTEGLWYNQTFPQWFSKVYDDTNPQEIFGERYTAAQVQWIIYSLASLPFTNAKDIVNCAFTNDKTLCVKGLQQLIASANQVAPYAQKINPNNENKNIWARVFLEDRPLSGFTYVRDQFRKFHIIPQAYAQTQGFGYDALSPVRPLWKAFRDFSYLLFTVIIIAFAFMIMFRVKISPQTVITVQSALPKIIFGLILVTFSYAIAGFMMDLMYVLMAIVSSIFKISLGNVPILSSLITNKSSENLLYTFMAAGTQASLFLYMGVYFILFLIAIFFALVYSVVSDLFTLPFIAAFFGVLILFIIIAVLILIIILLWNMLKIIWMLIKTVANIFMLTIFAPIQITFGVLAPSAGFSSWLKNLISNLLVFPVAGILMIISLYFLLLAIAISVYGVVNDNAIVEGIISWATLVFGRQGGTISIAGLTLGGNFWNVPFLGSGMMGLIFVGASFTMLSIIPKVAELIQSLFAGKPFAYGTAIGESFAPITSLPATMETVQKIGKAITGRTSSATAKAPPPAPIATTHP